MGRPENRPANEDDADALVDEARSYVGLPGEEAVSSLYPVNVAMIRHWCQALNDRNPAYDSDLAGAAGSDGLVAPPAMLGSWTLDTAGRDVEGPRTEVLRRLDRAGYESVVATDYEQIYHRPLRPGDRLSETLSVEELSARKETALGAGYFVMVRHDYRDEAGELVGVARMRLLKFRPRSRNGEGAGRRARPATNADTTHWWEGLVEGELRLQRCESCGELRHPPAPMCGACRSTSWTTTTATGRGVVASFVAHHHPPLPGFELPHTVLLVELDEGVRVAGELVGPADRLEIGAPAVFVPVKVDADLVVPGFRLAEDER